MKTAINISRLVRFCGFLLSVFCLLVCTTPLHAQWMQTISNSQRTFSDHIQTIQVKGEFKNLKTASTTLSGLLKNIDVARSPEQVIITKDNKFAFIRCFIGNTVELIDIKQGKVIKSFSIPVPMHLSLSNDGTKLMVASFKDYYIDPNLYPDDCQMLLFFGTGSVLTIIDIATQAIEHIYPINIDCIRKIMNSSNSDIIYIRSDHDILEFNLNDSVVTRSWYFSKQLNITEIDKKNNRIFMSNFTDSLKVLVLQNGSVLNVPYYIDSIQLIALYIAIDTLSNRVFCSTSGSPKNEILVFDAISLSQYAPIPLPGEAYSDFQSFLALPDKNTIYIGTFCGETFELDYQTLEMRNSNIISWNWHAMSYINKNSKLYTFIFGADDDDLGMWTPPCKLDLIEYDMNNDELILYETTDSLYECSYGRNISITSDDSILIVTNSPENTVSILYLEFPSSITNIDNRNCINVWPNPTSDLLSVSLNKPFDTDYIIEVYDIAGVLLETLKKNKSETNFNLDLNGFATGFYILHIYTANRNFQIKVIKK